MVQETVTRAYVTLSTFTYSSSLKVLGNIGTFFGGLQCLHPKEICISDTFSELGQAILELEAPIRDSRLTMTRQRLVPPRDWAVRAQVSAQPSVSQITAFFLFLLFLFLLLLLSPTHIQYKIKTQHYLRTASKILQLHLCSEFFVDICGCGIMFKYFLKGPRSNFYPSVKALFTSPSSMKLPRTT